MKREAAPRSLGRYELLFRIASGGMAEVYAARVRGEAGFQKLVAVKRMLPQLADDEEFTNMFLDEARVAANITSPHCVSTIDLGRAEDGSLYIVMELVVGVTLARILKWSVKSRKPIPVSVAVELLAQAAHGLHDAHEASTPLGEPLHIIHRDVSPQNVLVGVDGRVRLTDFGVARAVQRMTETVAGRVKGKFAYMAPEQLTAKDIDRRADIFSLGVVAWEFFSGQRLFVGEHPAETMDRVRNMPILGIDEIRPEVPSAVAAVVAKALERDPTMRWSTAREFEQQLRQAAVSAGITPDTDTVQTFVRKSGGDGLNKIRENIKLALTARPKEGELNEQLDQHVELGLTPSGVQSAVQSVSSGGEPHDTEPTTGAKAHAAAVDMDASAPSAAASPGEVITQLHIDESAFSVPVPIEPTPSASKKGLFLKLGAAAVVLIGFAVGAVVASTPSESMPEGDGFAQPAPTPPVAIEPTPGAELGAAEDQAPEGDETDAVEGEEEEVVDESETAEVAVDAPASMRSRNRNRRNTMGRRGTTTATMTEVAAAPQETTTPAMQTSPAMTTTMRGGGGLVGLDAFDQGLNMR